MLTENTFENAQGQHDNGRRDGGGGVTQVSSAYVTFFKGALKELGGLAHVVARVVSVAAAASNHDRWMAFL